MTRPQPRNMDENSLSSEETTLTQWVKENDELTMMSSRCDDGERDAEKKKSGRLEANTYTPTRSRPLTSMKRFPSSKFS